MTEAVFATEPARLLIAAAAGITLLLLFIIKFKIHPVLSLLISALVIGLGAGMPVPTLVSTVEKGAGETLQGIVLLIGLGSLFPRATSQVAMLAWIFGDCREGQIPRCLQRCKFDTPLLAAGSLIIS